MLAEDDRDRICLYIGTNTRVRVFMGAGFHLAWGTLNKCKGKSQNFKLQPCEHSSALKQLEFTQYNYQIKAAIASIT